MAKKPLLWQLITTTPLTAWHYVVTKVRLYLALFSSTTTPWHVKGLMVLALLYLLLPVDFIPDTLPIVGVMDDFAVLTLIFSYADGFITDEMRAGLDDSDE